jgi:hypothetical protein
MAIGHAGFQYVSTTTPGKLNTIQWQKQIVHNTYNKIKMDGKGICIPGHHSQLKRHIQELLDYGIAEENQIMVDWTYELYLNLKAEAERIGFKGKVVYGNLIDVVRELWENGEQVDVIDFDDTCYLEQYHLDLLKDACKKDVKVFIGVFTTRGNRGGLNAFQVKLKNQLKIRGYYHKRGNWTYSLRDLQGLAFAREAAKNSYVSQYKGYQGRSTMVSCIVTK